MLLISYNKQCFWKQFHLTTYKQEISAVTHKTTKSIWGDNTQNVQASCKLSIFQVTSLLMSCNISNFTGDLFIFVLFCQKQR